MNSVDKVWDLHTYSIPPLIHENAKNPGNQGDKWKYPGLEATGSQGHFFKNTNNVLGKV